MSRDDSRIVTGSDDTARVWDPKTFVLLGELKGQTGRVESVAVTPDGSRIVTGITGSDDTTARVWDARTLVLLGELKGHSSVAVSSGGGHRITRSEVWEIYASGQALIDEAKALVPRCLTRGQRKLYHLRPSRWTGAMSSASGRTAGSAFLQLA